MTNPQPLPADFMDLIERPLLAALGTTLPDGTPQVTPVWFSYADGYFYINTAVGRLKDRAIRSRPYVSLMIVDPDDMYRYIQIRGPVVEVDEAAGRAHIDFLAQRYRGIERYDGPPGEPRVRFKIAPERVSTMG